MKKDLDEMGIFFRKYDYCFLINRDGVIFLSSKSEFVFRSLWPLDKEMQESLMSSRQFGHKPFRAIYTTEMTDGMNVTLGGNDYFVSRKVIDCDGWSIVLLTPTGRISVYKLIGILITIGVCSLIMFFSGIIYITDRSKEVIRQSENKYRLLSDNVNDVIFVLDMNLNYT